MIPKAASIHYLVLTNFSSQEFYISQNSVRREESMYFTLKPKGGEGQNARKLTDLHIPEGIPPSYATANLCIPLPIYW